MSGGDRITSGQRRLSDDERWEAARTLIGALHKSGRPPVGSTAVRKAMFTGADQGPVPRVPASEVGRSFARYFGQIALGSDNSDVLLKRLSVLEQSDPELALTIRGEMAAALLNARIRAASGTAGSVIRKAKGAAQVAVYDERGRLVGTIDPSALNPIRSVSAPDAAPSLPPTQGGVPVSGAATEADLTPAPASAAGVAASTVAKRR